MKVQKQLGKVLPILPLNWQGCWESWRFSIPLSPSECSPLLFIASENYTPYPQRPGVLGGGGTHLWVIKAVDKGSQQIEATNTCTQEKFIVYVEVIWTFLHLMFRLLLLESIQTSVTNLQIIGEQLVSKLASIIILKYILSDESIRESYDLLFFSRSIPKVYSDKINMSVTALSTFRIGS